MIKLKKDYSIAILIAAAVVISMVPAVAATEYSYSVDWTGHGSDSQRCGTPNEDDPRYETYNETGGWMHWVFANKGESTDATKLVVNGDEYFPGAPLSANVWHFYTPFYNLTGLTATIYLDGEPAKPARLVISDYCPGDGGDGGIFESLTVLKTVDTSYNRTHNWSIDKYVETDYGYELGGFPKIWLFTDGSGNENATWTVDVIYEGYEDSDYMIWGEITIINGGNVPANITSVVDELAGTDISSFIDFGNITFPFTLDPNEDITFNYSVEVDSKVDGFNNVTVTTYNATRTETYLTYGSLPEEIVWGDPANKFFETVNISDLSDLFGVKYLGNVTAPYGDTFTYDKFFEWAAYYDADECGSFMYNNTATIIETNQSADATLKVNVQCYDYETAYAKGDDAICFIPTFTNWGWTNPIMPGTYTWDMWAAAGQCDTSKGTLVGNVTVVYGADGYVTVDYNVAPPYLLEETHVYAGYPLFPLVKQGKKWVYTVAPGQYTNNGPFDGSEVYVIAHAVVGIPDPTFGP